MSESGGKAAIIGTNCEQEHGVTPADVVKNSGRCRKVPATTRGERVGVSHLMQDCSAPALRAGDIAMQAAQSSVSIVTTRWVIIATALFAGIIAAGHVGKLPPALPSIRTELGLDLITASLLASLFSATGLVTGIFLGAIVDRFNHWRLAIGGLALMTLSGLCGALSATAAQLIVTRFFEGVGFLAVVIAAPSIIVHASSGRERSVALGLWPSYMPAGISLMILLAPFALRAGNWRTLWTSVAVLAALGTALMWIVGHANSREWTTPLSAAPLLQNIRVGASRLGPWLVAGCFALYGAQLYAVITWMPTFMIDERGIGAAMAAALTALIMVANGACNVLGSWLLHRGAVPWVMIALSGVIMAVSAFGTFSGWLPDPARYLCSVALCGAGGVVASATFAVAPSLAASPAQFGVVNGILVQASNAAQFVGPTALATTVAELGHWESALWLMIGANVMLTALALLLRRHEKAYRT
jgi:MFS family permease